MGLRPIAIEFLYEEMILQEDIYNFNGKVVLLVKGDVLTENKLEKLRNFNSNNRNICVQDETYKHLIDKVAATGPLNQKKIEEQYGYTKLKDAASSLLRARREDEKFSAKEAEIILKDIAVELEVTDPSIIFQLINAPRPIDEDLQRHCLNVSFLNGLMGEWLHLSEREIESLVLAGLVHDIGKTKIPSDILDAPRKLTNEEFEMIKRHAKFSYDILSEGGSFDEPVRLAALHHHEKIGGGGYPDNLKGDQISLFARITSVCDIYDALVSKRSYKDAKSPLKILEQFSNREFDGLDMQLVNVFVKNMPQQLVNKQVLMSDGTIGTIRFLMPNDLGAPIVDVDGVVRQGNEEWYCIQMIL